ncbi:hypothetical protein C8R44DRAFT_703912 [Mycena epipterygia]|nr:hypothetical protein C8R44DRAFT_703912 [Mycena epipterygia]
MTISAPSSTTGSLDFMVPPKDGARAYLKITAVSQDRNFTLEVHDVEIENLRGNESVATLDTTGFQLFRHPAKHTTFTSDAEIEKEYYPESIKLIKSVTGARRVVLFDHTVRRRRPNDNDDSPGKRQPASQTHGDQTNASAIARVHRHLPAEEIPELLKHRWQIINLWRPISHPALDWPLTFCDFRSVNPETDVQPIARIYSGSGATV